LTVKGEKIKDKGLKIENRKNIEYINLKMEEKNKMSMLLNS
jgi:hypothetical protein